MCEKQKFFLDMFYRVHEPLLMKEYETYGEKLIHEKDMFTVSCNTTFDSSKKVNF